MLIAHKLLKNTALLISQGLDVSYVVILQVHKHFVGNAS